MRRNREITRIGARCLDNNKIIHSREIHRHQSAVLPPPYNILPIHSVKSRNFLVSRKYSADKEKEYDTHMCSYLSCVMKECAFIKKKGNYGTISTEDTTIYRGCQIHKKISSKSERYHIWCELLIKYLTK